METNPAADDEDNKSKRETLYQEVLSDIRQRSPWEVKQVEFYRMRHNGVRRKQKPWPNAADLHFPLIDTNIEKLKPLFFQQIVGMDVVASFVPMRQQLAPATTTAEQWFDYKVRERTNLQDEALAWIDYSLMSGRGLIKITWNDAKKQVAFDAIDPMYVVVPSRTKELQDADRVVHIMPMSVAAYKRSGMYDTKKETLEKIRGQGDDKNDPGHTNLRAAKQLREGLTHTANNDRIIVWECYTKQADGTWLVETFCPNSPDLDLRPKMQLLYEHGMLPFVDFAYETKDKGWYSPRGIAEKLAAFEAAATHAWNQKHDTMQLFNKPVYRAEREIPNSMNLRVTPGQILPYGIAPVPMPQPPMSWDEEITFVRSTAEQLVANPDYGMGQVIDTKNRRTATEIQAIGAQTQQAGDLRARTFRMALGKVYKQTWALLLQFDKEDLQYRFQEDSLQVDPVALHEKYHIEPKGGVNEVNKQMLLQKAVARKQIFANSPWIDQAALDKSILNLDDPSLIKLVFRDPNLKGQDEIADETVNIPTLMLGNDLPVKPGEDYQARIGVLIQFLQKTVVAGVPLPEFAKASFATRLNGLVGALVQQDNNAGKKLGVMVKDFLVQNRLVPTPQTMAAISQHNAQPGGAPQGQPPPR